MHNLSIDRYNGRIGLRGLGTVQSAATAESIAGSGANATVATLVAMGTITGPVGLAISAIVGVGLSIASLFKGCGQTCIAATNIANQAGSLIDQAYEAYMSSPIHYASMQSAYLQLFDSTMQAMDAACSDPSLGAAGQRCISDRAQGSCAYHTSPGGWQQAAGGGWTYVTPGANGSGNACWNSWIGRRDPVANDPTVVPDPAGAITNSAGQVTSIVPSPVASVTGVLSSLTSSPLLLIGGLALLGLLGFMMMEKD